MKELINEIYNEKMNDGTIRKLIEKQIENLVTESCKSLFQWDGVIKKQMQNEISKVMSDAIKNSNFSDYVNAFTITINEALKNTALGRYKTICEGLNDFLGEKETPEVIKLTDLFEAWCDSLEEKNTIYYEDTAGGGFIEEGKYSVDVQMEVKTTSYGVNKIIFSVNDDTLNDCCELKKEKFEFEVYKNPGHLGIDDLKIKDLQHMDKFVSLLARINVNFGKIEIDKTFDEQSIDLDVEY